MKKRLSIAAFLCVMALAFFALNGSTKAYAADDVSTAETLALDGNWSVEKWLTEENGTHWYKIVIPADGRFDMKIMSYMNDLDWHLYDEEISDTIDYVKYSDWNNASETAPCTGKYSYVMSAGVYYLKTCEGIGKYKISGAFTDYKTNDQAAVSYDSPQVVKANELVTGGLTIQKNEDWYKIVIPQTRYYTFTVKSYMGDLDWYLYDADIADTIASEKYEGWNSATEAAPYTKKYSYVLEAGTYYFKACYGKGKYQFSWDTLTQSNCDHDYARTYVSSTYTKQGYTLYKCNLCKKQYKDDYKAKLVLGTTYFWTYNGVVSGKKKATLSWYSVYNATGYQIRYSTNKKMKSGVKTVKTKNTKKVIKKLKKKKYYFQVRAYRKEGKKTVYSAWSQKRSVKVK